MRGRNKLKTWLRWRQLKREALGEACYHAMHGSGHLRVYWWRYYERLKRL